MTFRAVAAEPVSAILSSRAAAAPFPPVECAHQRAASRARLTAMSASARWWTRNVAIGCPVAGFGDSNVARVDTRGWAGS